ncbi:MAG TPA: hypothetical protein VN778_03375 [Verrucomicrobiae bacterium]|nr:hypothetical protein [Verrucomicrobiae bacterium]
MSIYEAAEARDSVEQSLRDLQWLVIETLIHRKEVLDTQREFEVLVKAGKVNDFTQFVYRERFRRSLRDIDDMLRLIYQQRSIAKLQLRKLVG